MGGGTRNGETSAEQRARLIAGVGAVVAANGYEGADISSLVRAGGCARKTFYRAFGGKREAFRAMLEKVVADVVAILERNSNPEKGLLALLAYVEDNEQMVLAFLVDGHREPDIYPPALESFAALIGLPSVRAEAVVGGIAWAIRKGLSRGLPAPALYDDLAKFVMPFYEAA